MPQKAAGWRTEPPVSVPSATGTSPAATAAADPPLDPPATCSTFHGFLVRAEGRGLGRRAHAELIEIRLADHHRSRGAQSGDDRRVERRHMTEQRPAGAG